MHEDYVLNLDESNGIAVMSKYTTPTCSGNLFHKHRIDQSTPTKARVFSLSKHLALVA